MDKVIDSGFVEILVHNLSGHTLLKDVSTGKYIDANATHLSVYGFNKPEEIAGYDIWELNNVMHHRWEDNAKQIARFDEQVVHTGKSIIEPKRVWLNAEGFIWVHCMRKIPVVGCNNSITAILSLGEELTHSLTLNELYHYYLHFYQNKREAIKKFVQHIGISQYFYEMPNNTEVMVLISRSQNHLNKLVANQLNYQISTVHSYINQVSRKVTDLDKILQIMRSW